ncbi:diguanylate cyclase [Crassaminicella thermophila]|uniref:Diguanylate cyclase n=1 Tax=Crassaminicella thermophila TaxID=2599308 RepID=A0A5C0SGK4_CRATE|nr:diguanylate cyclase [Crassaminicella thermophila]QEK12787.1 diguanylate cyclase [Crassaminicella thermophila]
MLISKLKDKILKFITIKIIFIIAICIIIIIMIGTKHVSELFVNEIENQVQIELKQKVDIAYNTINPIIELRRKGKITVEEARKRIANLVRNMTYKDNYSDNYIFMSTYDGYYLVQPFEPEKEGRNMWDYRDVEGRYVIRELVKAAKQSPYGSYVKYLKKLPNTETVEEKLAYVKGIPEIDAYIGTGVYLYSKYRNLYSLLNTQTIMLLMITGIIVIFMMLYLYKLNKINSDLNDEIKKRLEIEKELITEKNIEMIQKSRLEILFNHSQDAIVEVDTKGRILNVNKSFEKIFGYSKEECLGKNIDKIIVPEEKLQEARELTIKTLKKGIVSVESVRYKKDKTPVYVLVRSIRIKINDKILGGYGIYTNITEVKNYEKKLEHMSMYDTLTGLYNYNYFNKELDKYEKNNFDSIAIIMCDLNGLKFVNDTLGHKYGDILLKSFADILKKSVREKDVVARIGGDEFSVILTETNKEKIENIVKRIYANIEEYNNSLDNKMLKLSVAIGFSITDNRKKKIEEVIKEADDIMYRNKLMNKSSRKNQILSILMAALAERDFVTSGHTKRVVKMCTKIADKIGLNENRKNKLILLAEVHDLGKIAIPDYILKKTGKLSQEEWEIMKSHTEKGYRIALNSHELSSIAELILKHHERWDGKGYPLGLSKNDIPLECRILAVVDSYDAMTNLRPYNQIKTHKEAIEEIKMCSGTQFDPEIVDIFISIYENNIDKQF